MRRQGSDPPPFWSRIHCHSGHVSTAILVTYPPPFWSRILTRSRISRAPAAVTAPYAADHLDRALAAAAHRSRASWLRAADPARLLGLSRRSLSIHPDPAAGPGLQHLPSVVEPAAHAAGPRLSLAASAPDAPPIPPPRDAAGAARSGQAGSRAEGSGGAVGQGEGAKAAGAGESRTGSGGAGAGAGPEGCGGLDKTATRGDVRQSRTRWTGVTATCHVT
jgi:hypothetical protein